MEIALALGGGGAKGNAHLGVIRVLERAGFCIRAVAGTSFGGMVAAFYALGKSPDEIEDLFADVDQTSLYGHLPEDGPSLLGVAGVARFLQEHFGERTFADLSLPCAVTAVDLKSAREVVLMEGRVRDAILATIALPGIFPPRRIGEWELVDGGILNPVPVTVARMLTPHLPVVAVVLTAPLGKPLRSLPMVLPTPLPTVLVQQIARLRPAQALQIFLQAVEIGNRQITELRLKVDRPEVVIRPNVHHIPLLGQVDVHEVAAIGELAAEQALPAVRRVVSWPFPWIRRFSRKPRIR